MTPAVRAAQAPPGVRGEVVPHAAITKAAGLSSLILPFGLRPHANM